jgi:hypothetical protein
MFSELLIGFILGLGAPFYLPKLLDRSQFPEHMSTLLTMILSEYEKQRVKNDRTDYIVDKLKDIENLIDQVYENTKEKNENERVISP